MVDSITLPALQQFREISVDARIVIIHPNYRQRRQLFSLFWESPNVYYWCPGKNGDADLSLSEQIKAELQAAGMSPNVLLLDDVDRMDNDALETTLMDYLTTNEYSKVVLLTRSVPYCTQTNPDLRRQTRYLPVDDDLMLPDYAARDENQHLLEVHAFGSGRVLLDGRQIDAWDGQLPRSLFYYLLDRGMATRDDIFQTFWPTLTKREATNVFHVTKRKISEILGVSLTTYSSGFYRISPDIELIYDALQFSEMVQKSAVAEPDAMLHLLLRAIWLYRGNFLVDLNMEWANRRRDELLLLKSEALATLAKLYHDASEWDAAIGRYVQAIAAHRLRDDVVAGVMQVYHHQNMPQDDLIVYAHFAQWLKQHLNSMPPDYLKQLVDEIRGTMRD